MTKRFEDRAWEEYLYWQQQDKKMLKRINKLLDQIERTPFQGSGKPEPLKHELSGKWSRRIDPKNRLVYSIKDEVVIIHSLKEHY
jgi:toxin YoeB